MAQPAREKIHKQYCDTYCRFGALHSGLVPPRCRELDNLLADLWNDFLNEEAGQQTQQHAHEPLTEFRVETFDGDVWHLAGSAVYTVEAARAKREGLRPRAPEQLWRIIRRDETFTVVESDEWKETGT